MFYTENVRNKIKVLLKISYNVNSFEYKISKLSPLISQYGVEDTNLIDSYILFKLENLVSSLINVKDFTLSEFYLPILIILFRDETETELFLLPPSQQELLKLYLNKKFKLNKYFFFILNSLGARQYLFGKSFYLNFYIFLKTLNSKVISFKTRDFLRSRKINFRRKIKKDGYTDV